MTRSLSRLQTTLLSMVVLLGLTIGAWGVFQIGLRQGLFAETYELRAGFNQAHGLDRGTPVRVRGVDAGQVIGVELPPADDPAGKVIVRLRLRRQFQPMIPADSKAVVLNEGVLGGRLINIAPGKQQGTALNHGDEIAVIEAQELTDIMNEASQTLREIRDSNGTLAKLMKSDEAHKEMLKLVKDTQDMVKKGHEALSEGKETLASVKQDADAIKRLPLLRGYVEDTNAILYRPDQDADRRVYAADDLFQPGTSSLTDKGREHLTNLGAWIEAGKVKNSEMVVVSYADPNSAELPGAAAQTLTLKQSEAVVAFLRDSLRAHRMSWVSSRKIIALGMGHASPPIPEKVGLAPFRTEIVVFRPR